MNHSTIKIVAYKAEYGLETLKMIRESFHRAMSLEHHNRFDDVSDHLEFFSTYNPKHIRVAIDIRSSAIVGCMVLKGSELEQLYIHIDYQRNGIGGRFIDIAKKHSPNRLELFTFQQNTRAQAFYKKHEFIEKARGLASRDGNPWAVNTEQLADIRFVWSPKYQ